MNSGDDKKSGIDQPHQQAERTRLSLWLKEYLSVLRTKINSELRSLEQVLDEHSRSGGSTLSGCPGGGGVSGGICRPFNNEDRSTWQTTYDGGRTLRIMDCILPGTHNSGFDKEASYQNSWETCQDVSPWRQLMTGIRVLDLRVEFKANASGAQRFSIFHKLNSGRTVDGDIIQAVINFRTEPSTAGNPRREIIILDFHEFKNFTDAAHKELA